jgi:hypothetical protein
MPTSTIERAEPVDDFKHHLTMTCHVPNISTVDGSISGGQNCLTYETLVD